MPSARENTIAGVVIALFLTTPAIADDVACSRAAKVAEKLMEIRQRGTSLQDAMDAMISSYPKFAHPLARKLVMDAYAVPRFSSAEYQLRAIGDFRDKAHLACLKSG